MDDEWGPWIEYAGTGYLQGVSLGMIVQIEAMKDGVLVRSPPRVVVHEIMCLKIIEGPGEQILRHRIRKPRGLTVLQEIADGVRDPEWVDA